MPFTYSPYIIPLIVASLITILGFAYSWTHRKTAGALALAVLTFSGQIVLWHIYALTAIQAVAVAFDSPARQAMVPNLVPVIDLPNAFSLNSIAYQTGAIVGPAMSGLFIAYWGQGSTYLFDALSYGAVLLALLLLLPARSPQATERRELAGEAT
jgi:MFS family permease